MTSHRTQLLTERSPFIAERRRKLFDSETCDADDLGPMSPLSDDEFIPQLTDTPVSHVSMSPLKLSPVTPRKLSPSHQMKTPHDTSTKNILEREQKSLMEESKSQKKEMTKCFDGSKVRQALFPDIAVPAKSFYANSPRVEVKRTKLCIKPLRHAVKHQLKSGRIMGQINNGVSHKIRKPKLRKLSKAVTKKMLATSDALNEYIQDLSDLRNKPKKQLIENIAGDGKENSPPLSPIEFDDLDFEDSVKIDNILSVLDEPVPEKITPAVDLHQILSPISQMCSETSTLALNSPKRDMTTFLGRMSSRTSKMLSFAADMDQKKLFPVFGKNASSGLERGEKRVLEEAGPRRAKRFKGLPPDQMLLDAGQKKFGFKVCTDCNIVYHEGDPNDEIRHNDYHESVHVLRFTGWKNERVVADFQPRGRIIKVLPSDSKLWLKKVDDLMNRVVLRDLGCYEMSFAITDSQVYLYIINRAIAGCIVATVPKNPGHRMLSPIGGVVMCSEESYPIKCGISYMWVAEKYRKQGVASSLMDAVKGHFLLGEMLTNDDVALTSPTDAGMAFAEKYFKTPNFLIYYV